LIIPPALAGGLLNSGNEGIIAWEGLNTTSSTKQVQWFVTDFEQRRDLARSLVIDSVGRITVAGERQTYNIKPSAY
jgi:hypothetical protein